MAQPTLPLAPLARDAALPRSAAGERGRWLPAAVAALLGLTLLAGAGLAPSPALHSATHDARHTLGFPCH